MTEVLDRFDGLLAGWLRAAADEFGYPAPTDEARQRIYTRLPEGLRELVAKAYADGLVLPVGGYKFTLRGLPAGKGPYAWMSRSSTQLPTANWEYLVQAAEYARVQEACAPRGFAVAVEDRLMDISVSLDEELLWYIEVKEKADDIPEFAKAIAGYGRAGVALDAEDRGQDALRKAKTLILYRRPYFTLTAIGIRLDYRVSYEDNRFSLAPDMVPLA